MLRPAEPALADYNLTGQWQISIGGGAPCPATISQGYASPTLHSIHAFVVCPVAPEYPGSLAGQIDVTSGEFFVSGTLLIAYVEMSGTLSPDNHAMSGTYYVDPQSAPPSTGTFTGTGGSANPKPPPPSPTNTPLPTATPTSTPAPVGGLATDAPSGDSPTYAWWVAALAAAAVATLGGAALYARSRFATDGTHR